MERGYRKKKYILTGAPLSSSRARRVLEGEGKEVDGKRSVAKIYFGAAGGGGLGVCGGAVHWGCGGRARPIARRPAQVSFNVMW